MIVRGSWLVDGTGQSGGREKAGQPSLKIREKGQKRKREREREIREKINT
jgi:hypothetical protein